MDVNYWPKHIGPWLKATVTLSMAEEGCYSRLCDWCYGNEQPLPLDTEEVFKIARAASKPERDTTMTVVQRYFIQAEDGWHHSRIERELANARRRGATSQEFRTLNAERQKRYRDRRRLLYAQAYELGVPPANGMLATNEQLVELIVNAGGKPRYVESDVTRDVTDNASRSAVVVTAPETVNALSQYFGEERDGTGVTSLQDATQDVTRNVTRAGAMCKRMRSLGLASVNPSDPRLLELLALGVPEDDIALAAGEAVARHKGFAWALVRARGQWDDQQRERDQLRKWAPGL